MIIKGKLHEKIYLDVEIKNDHIIDGGVYVFYINKGNKKNEENKKILYVGETNLFFSRISQHIIELKKSKSYFGLEMLEEVYTITLGIHCSGYPHDFDNDEDYFFTDRKEEEGKFLNMKNSSGQYINKSLTQYVPNSKKQNDNMVSTESRNDSVKNALEPTE